MLKNLYKVTVLQNNKELCKFCHPAVNMQTINFNEDIQTHHSIQMG